MKKNRRPSRRAIYNHNLRAVRYLLRKRGVAGADQMSYDQARELLAKLVAQEVREGQFSI